MLKLRNMFTALFSGYRRPPVADDTPSRRRISLDLDDGARMEASVPPDISPKGIAALKALGRAAIEATPDDARHVFWPSQPKAPVDYGWSLRPTLRALIHQHRKCREVGVNPKYRNRRSRFSEADVVAWKMRSRAWDEQHRKGRP